MVDIVDALNGFARQGHQETYMVISALLRVGLAMLPALTNGSGSDHWCLYLLDGKDGNVYRSRVDGSHRELVVACRKFVKSPFPVFLTGHPWPAKGLELELSGTALNRNGNTVLDIATSVPRNPKGGFALDHILWTDRGDQPCTDTGKPSGWNVSYRLGADSAKRRCPIAMVFTKAGLVRTFNLAGRNRDDKLLALFSDGKAVVIDAGAVTLWDLRSDRRRIVAKVQAATLWPRDLAKSSRFAVHCRVFVERPTATLQAGRYGWDMKNPQDWNPRGEYRRG